MAATCAATAPPNIVLILTDDQGWTDSSVQMDPDIPQSRSSYYQTPNLEALASAGMRFSNGYSGAPACAQTRASLMTGKSPAQLQMTELVWYTNGSGQALPLTGPVPQPFDPTQPTIPRIVKQANPNYQTALFGKWHLDLPAATTPQASGFDTYQNVGNSAADPMGVFALTQLTNNYMQNAVQSGKPFFIELAHHAPHELYGPGGAYIPARQELIDKYNALPKGIHNVASYAALLEDMDTSVGQVLAKIDELGIADNTYVIFASDNGGSIKYTNNAPLKVGKGIISEGGIRVPFMVKGPGIQPGTFSDVPVVTTDLMATIASLTGYSGDIPAGQEGADLSPVLFNGGELPEGVDHLQRQFSERGEVYFHFPHYFYNGPRLVFKPASAVRDGDYKLYVEYELNAPDRLFLYNLETDVGESMNLAAQMPQKAAELKSMLDNYLTAVDASMAYDIKASVQLSWDAGSPGADPTGWRSTRDMNYKGAENWSLGAGAERPTVVNTAPYQQGLSDKAFAFDGNDVMRHVFFQVGNKVPRDANVWNLDVGTPDFDRSASIDMWFRTAGLNRNQILFEAGDNWSGLSLTMGDADADGSFDDLRFRIGSGNGQYYDITAPINAFANPVADFVNATAVVNDNDADRFIELYINGALAGRVDVPEGIANSLNWDSYDQAGLGRMAGGALGGSGGGGNMPFNGAFVGQIAEVNFWNHAIAKSAIATNYNAHLDAASLGIQAQSGNVQVPPSRPTDLRLGASESSQVQVFEERRGVLSQPLAVSAAVSEGASNTFPHGGTGANLAAGAEFTSYLLHFDPQGNSSGESRSVTGSVTFVEEIIAVLYDGAFLTASDAVLGSAGHYGALANRGVDWQAGDYLTVDESQRTLSFNFTVLSDQMLQLRVLTAGVAAGGDFNGDGTVDAADLVRWQESFGGSPNADADGDGDSDGRDFLAWQRQLGGSTASPAAALVPEPAAAAWSVAAAGGIFACRRSVSRRRPKNRA